MRGTRREKKTYISNYFRLNKQKFRVDPELASLFKCVLNYLLCSSDAISPNNDDHNDHNDQDWGERKTFTNNKTRWDSASNVTRTTTNKNSYFIPSFEARIRKNLYLDWTEIHALIIWKICSCAKVN